MQRGPDKPEERGRQWHQERTTASAQEGAHYLPRPEGHKKNARQRILMAALRFLWQRIWGNYFGRTFLGHFASPLAGWSFGTLDNRECTPPQPYLARALKFCSSRAKASGMPR